MSRLFISIGFDSKKGSAKPELVYLGRSGSDQQTAESASPLPHLLRFNHAIGIPKNNSRAAANAAALDVAESDADVIEVSPEEMKKFEAHLVDLQKLAEGRAAEVIALTAELAKVKADLSAALAAATPVNPAPAVVPPNSPEQGEPSQAPSPAAAEPAEAPKPGGRRR